MVILASDRITSISIKKKHVYLVLQTVSELKLAVPTTAYTNRKSYEK